MLQRPANIARLLIGLTIASASAASAADFWGTLAACGERVEKEEVDERFEGLGWTTTAPSTPQIAAHNRNFNLHYALNWTPWTKDDVVREISKLGELTKPMEPSDPRALGHAYTDTNGESVLSVAFLPQEQLCFITAPRNPLRMKYPNSKSMGDAPYQLLLGSFLKGNVFVAMYDEVWLQRQPGLRRPANEILRDGPLMPHPFVAAISYEISE